MTFLLLLHKPWSQLFCSVPFKTKTWRKSSCPVSSGTSLISLFQIKFRFSVSPGETALKQSLSPLKYGTWITILDTGVIKQCSDSLFPYDLDCSPWYEACLSYLCSIGPRLLYSFCSLSGARWGWMAHWFWSLALRFISGVWILLTPTLKRVWTWASYTLHFSLLSYKIGRMLTPTWGGLLWIRI